MIPLSDYLTLAAIVFAIALAGVVINRKNLIVLLMCVELMLLAVNTNFIAFAQYLHAGAGEIFVFFILTVAAAESAIGLAILVLIYRKKGSIEVETMNQLKG
jgi:NADH-quinone oxidoreductase subunit K